MLSIINTGASVTFSLWMQMKFIVNEFILLLLFQVL